MSRETNKVSAVLSELLASLFPTRAVGKLQSVVKSQHFSGNRLKDQSVDFYTKLTIAHQHEPMDLRRQFVRNHSSPQPQQGGNNLPLFTTCLNGSRSDSAFSDNCFYRQKNVGSCGNLACIKRCSGAIKLELQLNRHL